MSKKKKLAKIREAERQNRMSGLLDIITPTVLDFQQNTFTMGDAECSVGTISTYPAEGFPGWLALFSEQPNMIASYHCKKVSTKDIVDSINKTINELEQKENDSKIKQTELDTVTVEKNRLRQFALDLQASNKTAVNVTINYMSYDTDRDSLDTDKRNLEGQLEGRSFRGRNLKYLQEDGLKSMLPICYNPFDEMSGLDMTLDAFTGGLGFFPTTALNDLNGGSFLGTDTAGNPCFLDIWSRKDNRSNSNMIVLGNTGKGKSTFLKDLAWDRLAKGDHMVVLDPQGEYTKMAEVMHGNIINGSGMNETRINPFELRDIPQIFDDITDERVLQEKINSPYFKGSLSMHMDYLKQWFQLYVPALADPRNAIEYASLEQALYEMYRSRGITEKTDPRTKNPEDYPIMQDLFNVLTTVVDKHMLGDTQIEDVLPYDHLRSYILPAVTGADRFMFNGSTTCKLNRALNVFDVMDLLKAPSNVLNAQFYNITSYCNMFMYRSRKEHTIMLVDEAHLFLKEDNAIVFKALSQIMRRCRAFGGSLWISTQNIADMLTKSGKSQSMLEGILNNPSIHVCFNQGSTDIENLKRLFNLSDTEAELVSTADRGQCLLIAGIGRFFIQVQVNPGTLEIIRLTGGE